jgi:hypothetical protein
MHLFINLFPREDVLLEAATGQCVRLVKLPDANIELLALLIATPEASAA